MLSLHPVKQAGQAAHYFAQDNYYTMEQGLEKSEWHGKAAEELGLKGEVEKESFFRLLEGQVAGQQVGRSPQEAKQGERSHRPGTDLTFSAPKSVSVLAEVHGLAEVRQAHEKATKVALGYVEAELLSARVTKDGETTKEPSTKAIFALFRHNTSRSLDPQTHTHAILMNLGKTDDSKWRSIINDTIYKERSLVGAIYNNELAKELRSLGYELTKPDGKGNFEVAGISQETIKAFSTRRDQVIGWLESKGIDPATATLKEAETAALSTRAAKTQVDHVALLEAWQQKAKELGDSPARPRAEHTTPSVSGKDALGFAIAHLYEREMIVSRESLLKTAMIHSQGRTSASEILSEFNMAVKNGELVQTGDGEFTAKKLLASERWSLESIRSGKSTQSAVLSKEQLDLRLAAEAERTGLNLSTGQREAIALALTTEDRFVAVQGLAGTGKTTMLLNLNRIAEDAGMVVRAMAPTGAAAKQLSKETGISTETVAMFQIKERALAMNIAEAKAYAPDFERKKELWVVDESSFLSQRQLSQLNKMAEVAGARMVYLGDTAQLQGVEAGKPFEVAQKDGMSTAQMHQIARQKTDETKAFVGIIVEDIVASKDGSPPSNTLKNNARAFQYLDESGRVHEIAHDKVIQALVKKVREVTQETGQQPLVITPYNRDRKEINEAMREDLKSVGVLSSREEVHTALEAKGWTRAKLKEAQYYGKGDVVRFNRAYKDMPVLKGEYATVIAVDSTARTVELVKADGQRFSWMPHKHNQVETYDAINRPISVGEDIRITRNSPELKNGETVKLSSLANGQAVVTTKSGEKLTVDLHKDRHWDYAYASTVHSSQGSTAHTALMLLRTDDKRTAQGETVPLSEAELKQIAQVVGDRSYYVGATRASHRFEMYVTDKAKAQEIVSQQQSKSSAVEALGEISTRNQRSPQVAF